MEWTDLVVEVKRESADTAVAIATGLSDAGLYIEDYADLEEQVWEIAHVDLIEQELLEKSKEVVRIHMYLSPEENVAEMTDTLGGRLLAAGVEHSFITDAVEQEDWENAWKQYYHPVEIGQRLLVSPSWEDCQPGERTLLRLDPGMAFGTGTHETTVLCMEALDELVRGGETLLDIGTGSGILAVSALLLGAGNAVCVDIDPVCVRTARENAELNHVDANMDVRLGDLASQAQGTYNIITANIIADAIIRLAPEVPSLLADGGVFIASGIITEREAEVASALRQAGLSRVEPRRKNNWSALVCGV